MVKPTLYIIARKDIPDLNPGKLAAQVAHAQADFDEYVAEKIRLNHNPTEHPTVTGWRQWKGEKNFGRTIVLQATLEELQFLTTAIGPSALTVDNSYPWKNFYGDTVITKEVTCAWFFSYSANEFALERIQKLPLHP